MHMMRAPTWVWTGTATGSGTGTGSGPGSVPVPGTWVRLRTWLFVEFCLFQGAATVLLCAVAGDMDKC